MPENNTDIQGCRALWCAVVQCAVEDLRAKFPRKPKRKQTDDDEGWQRRMSAWWNYCVTVAHNRLDAARFFLRSDADWIFDAAGVARDTVCRKMKQEIERAKDQRPLELRVDEAVGHRYPHERGESDHA